MGLLSKEMIADLIINLINIGVLVILVRFLLYKPVKKILDKRKEELRSAEAKAAERELEAAKSKEAYDVLINDAEKIKIEAEAKAKEDAKSVSAGIINEAKEKADRLLSDARVKAEKEHDEMIENAKSELTDIALQMAEKVLDREITDKDNVRIIESFFGEKKQKSERKDK